LQEILICTLSLSFISTLGPISTLALLQSATYAAYMSSYSGSPYKQLRMYYV